MPPTDHAAPSGMTWLVFAGMTICTWGLYGPMLLAGQLGMKDKESGGLKAFLFVGVAYFLVAVLAPAALLLMRGTEWSFEPAGWKWSLFAGVLGAVGAFTLLLALGSHQQPPNVIMSIVFAGAPIVTSLYVLFKQGTFSEVKWPFVAGVFLAAVGGCLVALYRPDPSKPAAPLPAVTVAPTDALKSTPVEPETKSP
ncbi:MAG: hypothetical protein HY291_16885 [Planctomycetes bacterium]|nr:hypothetical protein [Planctomycetota bacterium]